MRIVFDTNVLISAFITTQGIAARLLRRGMEDHEVVLSGYILNEFKGRLTQKLRYPHALADQFVRFLEIRAVLRDIPQKTGGIDFPDLKDIPILHFLEATGAHYFVTGDKRLLALKKHKHTLILSLREALELL